MRGELNTICLHANSAPPLVVQGDRTHPRQLLPSADRDHLAGVVEILEALPQGSLRYRLINGEGKVVQKELQRVILSDALARGEVVEGLSLVKGSPHSGTMRSSDQFRQSEAVDDLNRPNHLIVLTDGQSVGRDFD